MCCTENIHAFFNVLNTVMNNGLRRVTNSGPMFYESDTLSTLLRNREYLFKTKVLFECFTRLLFNFDNNWLILTIFEMFYKKEEPVWWFLRFYFCPSVLFVFNNIEYYVDFRATLWSYSCKDSLVFLKYSRYCYLQIRPTCNVTYSRALLFIISPYNHKTITTILRYKIKSRKINTFLFH